MAQQKSGPKSPRRAPSEHHIVELQRAAGNAAVSELIGASQLPSVQRGVGHYAAEFVKDTYNLVHGEKEEEKEKDPDLIKDTLEQATKRIGQMQKGLTAGKYIAQNEELAEKLGEASEITEKYGGYVEKSLTGYKVYKLARAAKALDKVDLMKDPEGGAEALDEFFSTLGEAGEDVCDLLGPEAAPAKPYFHFLTEMKHFFTDWARFIKAYNKRIEDAANGEVKAAPEPEVAGATPKEAIVEKPVKFDRIADDLKEKQTAYEAGGPDKAAQEILKDAIDAFMKSYSPLLDLWKQRKAVGILGFKITSAQRQQADALLGKMAPLHEEAQAALEWIGQALPVSEDKKALDRYYR